MTDEAIGTPQCKERPGQPCCVHEAGRNSLHIGDGGSMTKTERCCWCGDVSVLHFTRERDPAHGQYAVPSWRRINL